MTTVMARDGSRLLSGSAAAAQRLADALRIQRGAYPFSRGYGAKIADLVDRPLNERGEAAIYAAVAEAIRDASNDLGDVRLRGVRVQADPARPNAVVVEVDAWWLPAPAGAATPITARAALDPAAGPEPAEPTNFVPHSFILIGDAHRDGTMTIQHWRPGRSAWTDLVRTQVGAAPGVRGAIVWDGARLVGAFGDRWFTVSGGGGQLAQAAEAHGSAPGSVTGLAWVRGALYGAVAGQWASIDHDTFAATFRRRIDSAVSGMAFDGRRLWGVDGLLDRLVRIDPATGAVTDVGALGPGTQRPRGVAWDPATETLVAMDGKFGLLRISRGTGAAERLDGGVNSILGYELGLTAVPTHLLPAA